MSDTPSELENLKYQIENGESWIYVLDNVDLDAMKVENPEIAAKIELVLSLIDDISEVAGIEY